jgi:predicted short-subunit dehydrogenase-like oxidoreductase (DUF2520 family)
MATRRKKKSRALPSVVVVGFGRMGGALALGLKRAKWPVSVLARTSEAVKRVVTAGLHLADLDALAKANLCLLCVPDGAVAQAAELVREDIGARTALVHCSGALTLAALGAAPKRPIASFHPLAAISDAHDELAGHSVAVAANDEALKTQLYSLAKALKMSAFEVPETGRAAYHAGAVLSAGLLVSLADVATSALQSAGLSREAALQALLPLMGSALRGVSNRGLEKGLTGPVVRGDVAVVHAHLDALSPESGAIYRLLSRRALALTHSLPEETRAALARLLA